MGRVDAAMRAVKADRGATRPEPIDAREPLIEAAADPRITSPDRMAPPVSSIGRRPGLFAELAAALPGKIVVDDTMAPSSRRAYRRLAASLHQAQAGSGLQLVMISSALPGEGKTLTAANLSLTLSESYARRVLLIDADLRGPSLHVLFRVPASPGLTDGLKTTEPRTLPTPRLSSNLSLLTSGAVNVDPMAGLTSPRMRQILTEARATFDWVILDTPPVGLLSDASLLADSVDTTLFVVKAEETPDDLARRAVDILGAHRVLGIVLNRADTNVHRHGYGYHSTTLVTVTSLPLDNVWRASHPRLVLPVAFDDPHRRCKAAAA
jgi:receptor protein-tyrosine kinase